MTITFPTITAAIEWLAEHGITTQGDMARAGLRLREVHDEHPRLEA